MIHHTTIPYEGKILHWVSLDGDYWLPVTRPPAEGEEGVIAKLFEGDGNFMPMSFGTSYLIHMGAEL